MKTLEAYQVDLVDKVVAQAATCRRICLQCNTGGGKTLMAAHLIQRAVAKGKRCLFVADRRDLIFQSQARFEDEGIYCSPLMANAGRINWNASVFVGSKDTLIARTVKSDKWKLPKIDFAICDEAHRQSKAYLSFLDSLKCFTIGLTATPIVRGKPLDFYAATVIGPPNKVLVDSGRLVPCRVYAPAHFDVTGIPLLPDGEFSPKAMGARQAKIVGDVVAHWRKIANGTRTVCFASNLEHALDLQAKFQSTGATAEYMDAQTDNAERQAIWGRVKTLETQIVCVFGVGVEGIDVPELETCILAIACGSISGYLQRVGRVRRSFPGKSYCTVLDHGSNIWRFCLPEDDVAWEVAQGLKDDESFERKLQEESAGDEKNWEIVCPACSCVFRNRPTCPQCGRQAEEKAKKAKLKFFEEGSLIEVKSAPDSADHVAKGMLKTWISACFITKARRGKMGMAAHIFKGKAGHWPRECGASISPLPTGADNQMLAEEWMERHPVGGWKVSKA